MKNKKLTRKILISLLATIAIILFFASSITRWYIHKNDEALIGREVNIGELHINYLTVSIDIKNFVMFEENKVDTFVSFNHFHVNAQPWNMINNEYALKKFLLDGLYVKIEQNDTVFNFSDLIPQQDTTIAVVDTTKEQKDAKFSFKNISITNSNFDYIDKKIDNLITLQNLNLNLPLLAWNNEKSEVGIDFEIGESGHLYINANVNNEDQTYDVTTKIDSVDLNPFSIYLKPHINTSEIQGFLSSNILVKGSMVDYTNVIVSGNAGIYDFVMPDDVGNPIFTTQMFYIGLDSIDIKNNYYVLNKIELAKPQFWVSTGKGASNIEKLLGPTMNGDTVTTIDTAIVSDADSVPIRYRVDSIIITNGEVNYADASLNRQFIYNISSINMSINDITEDAENVPVAISMTLNKKGTFNGNASINMQTPENFTFNGDIKNLDLVSFSPFSEYYVSYPISQGHFNYSVEIEMTATTLKNENSISINELEFGNKTKDTTAIKAPVRMALYILKDKNDKIAFDLPVAGNPSNPDFSLREIIWETLSNFFVKTAAEPFSALAGLVGTSAESIQFINFKTTQDSLTTEQRNTLDKLGEILEKKPEFIFTLTQETPSQNEMQELATKQVIIDYLLKTNFPASVTDSLLITNTWSTFKRNNTNFTAYVNNKYGITDESSLEQKCIAIIGKESAKVKFTELLNLRNTIIHNYLINKLGIPESNIVVNTADIINMRTQFEHPIYRIEVSMQ